MFRSLPVVFLLIFTRSVFAVSANSCVLTTAPRSIDSIKSLSCELEIKTADCGTYFQANDLPKEKMRSCNDDAVSGPSFLESCAEGAKGLFSQLFESTAGNLKTQSEKYAAEELKQRVFENICEQDQSLTFKRSLEKSARLEGVSHEVKDEELKKMSCKKLMEDVQAREIFREFQQYADKLETEKFKIQWDEARKNALLSFNERVVAEAEKVGILLQCYNAAAKTEVLCKVAAALITGAALKKILTTSSSTKTGHPLHQENESSLPAKAVDEEVLAIPGTSYNWRLDPKDTAHVQDHIWNKGAFKDLSINDYETRQSKFYDSLTTIVDKEELLKRRNSEISQTLKNADKDQKRQLGASLSQEFKVNTENLDKLKKQRLSLIQSEASYLPENATSYFTSRDLGSVMKDISKLDSTEIETINKAGFQSSMYRATIKKAGQETKVVIVVCEKSEGCVREGTAIPRGRPLTIYPECGPDVVKINYGKGSLIDSLAKKDADGKVVRIPKESFVTSVKCK